jgi:hypothetical protein
MHFVTCTEVKPCECIVYVFIYYSKSGEGMMNSTDFMSLNVNILQ